MTDGDRGENDQLRLHTWPDWDQSIREARARLKYETDWTPRPGASSSRELLGWIERVELRRFVFEARRALIDLRLPERFTDYWLACFLAPYEEQGFEAILDPQPDGTVRAQRVFPPPAELWFDAGIDYSAVPYKLVIEGPAALASSTVLRAAMRRALAATQKAGLPTQHPLVHARQIGPVLDNRAAARAQPSPARDVAVRRARRWRDEGEKPGFIAYRLGQRGYRVSERTVRRWIDANETAKVDTPLVKFPGEDETGSGGQDRVE